MKKTLTANISGTVFHIEEDAYDRLQRYLANIRAQFTGSDGRDEIMSDIEARIAELFAERLQGRQVVSIAEVEHVISVMGQPEDFADGDPEGPTVESATEQTTDSGKSRKRFFRDPDDKWVGGVLGGLGAYIGMDPLWLRIAMIVLVWASVGSLIPLYVLLWILVPTADNAAERLQMRGEPVTVDNIKRVVEEGAERVKHGSERFANEASNWGKDWQQRAGRNRGRAGEIIAKLVGIVLTVLAFGMLMGLVTGAIGGSVSLWHATWTSDDTGLLDLGELVFPSRALALWFGIGLFTLLVIPVIGLFLTGFRLLLNTRTPSWLGWSLAAAWFLALIPTIWAGVEVGRDFKRENGSLTEIELTQPGAGMLYLDALAPADSLGEWSVHFDNGEMDIDLDGLHLSSGIVHGAWAQLDVERSADTLFHLKVMREAHGNTAKAALARAEDIGYSYAQQGDVLLVSPVIQFSSKDKFRGQDVQFTLEVPLGKSVFLRHGSKKVIYDIDNVTNTLDRKMLGRTWTMTSRGLEDLNSPGSDQEHDEPAPVDTVRAQSPVAAVVYQGPSKRKAKGQERTGKGSQANTVDPAVLQEQHGSLVPNVLALLIGRIN